MGPMSGPFGQLAQYYSWGNASCTVAQDWLTETFFWLLKFKRQPESFVESNHKQMGEKEKPSETRQGNKAFVLKLGRDRRAFLQHSKAAVGVVSATYCSSAQRGSKSSCCEFGMVSTKSAATYPPAAAQVNTNSFPK